MLGEACRRNIENRFKVMDYALLESPFQLRNEDDNGWRCEFWGKLMRAAVTAAFSSGDPELRSIIDKSVANIMAAQTPDGCISSYPEEKQLSAWDIWGRKYVILGLLRYYEMLDPDPAVLQCCCRVMDHLMSQLEERGDKNFLNCGQHGGLAASSILGAVVTLWRLTSCERYRAFAADIIASGCSRQGNLFEDIDAGILPSALGNGKAYEMTSCIQGVVLLELAEPGSGNVETFKRYWKAVREREIFITGTGGTKDRVGEFWFDGALRQTRIGSDMALGETCVTATWLRFCADMLKLTDDPAIADEMERCLYNALLGALAPDGSHWTHKNPTPLTGGGAKLLPPDQMESCFRSPFGGHDCCRAQGPEGLFTAVLTAVTEKDNTVTLNLFEPLESGDLVVRGNYPVENKAYISFTGKVKKSLRLRTPEFLLRVTLNGEELPFVCGKWLVIDREWNCGDEVVMEFDFSLKEIPAPDGSPFVAVRRGPLVLAADSRGSVDSAFVNTQWKGIPLCDYASAGNLFSPENTLCVWFRKEM